MLIEQLKETSNIESVIKRYGHAGAVVYAERRYIHGESNYKALKEARKKKA